MQPVAADRPRGREARGRLTLFVEAQQGAVQQGAKVGGGGVAAREQRVERQRALRRDDGFAVVGRCSRRGWRRSGGGPRQGDAPEADRRQGEEDGQLEGAVPEAYWPK